MGVFFKRFVWEKQKAKAGENQGKD